VFLEKNKIFGKVASFLRIYYSIKFQYPSLSDSYTSVTPHLICLYGSHIHIIECWKLKSINFVWPLVP
jgi:hypothetical protein